MPLDAILQVNFLSPQSGVKWQLYAAQWFLGVGPSAAGVLSVNDTQGGGGAATGIYSVSLDISQAIGIQWTCDDPLLTRQQDLSVLRNVLAAIATLPSLTAMKTLVEPFPLTPPPGLAQSLIQISNVTGALPSAVQNADAILARDLGSETNAGALDERTVRSALRFLRNKWGVTGGVLTVTKEDDNNATPAWTAAVSSNAAADPIVGTDPT